MRCFVPDCINDTKNETESNGITFHRNAKQAKGPCKVKSLTLTITTATQMVAQMVLKIVLAKLGYKEVSCGCNFTGTCALLLEHSNATLLFSRFPKDLRLRSLWMESLGVVNWELEKCSVVCSAHFPQDAFYETRRGIRRVKKKSIPVSDIEIFSILQIKLEPFENEMEVDGENTKIKQELLGDDEKAGSSNASCTIAQNGNVIDVQKKVRKREFYVKTTEQMLPDIKLKQELIIDVEISGNGKSNCVKAFPNSPEVTSINDSSGCVIEEQGKVFHELPVTSETEKGQFEKACSVSDLGVLSKNIRNHVEGKPFACEICEYRSKFNHQLTTHMKTHTHEKPFGCPQCDYRCKYKPNLTSHMMSHTGEKPFACHICDYRCRQKVHLTNHMKTHTREKPFACRICAYKCVQKVHLDNHMKTHTQEKPFTCLICDYKCKYKPNLITHMTTHSAEKPFACQMCEYRSKLKHQLTTHMKTHTREKPFRCQQCDYRCKYKHSLSTHMQTHTGEKPFACHICDYRCKQRGHLTSHMRSHTGEKPFACQICDCRFRAKQNLTTHIRSHSGGNPFACPICDCRFKSERNLAKHTREEHTE